MKFTNKNKEESLLLYLEARAVDYSGRVDTRNMDNDDMKLAESWNEKGYIHFGKICSDYINDWGSHWVHLSEEAYADAATLRREIAERDWKEKRYVTTEEKRRDYSEVAKEE